MPGWTKSERERKKLVEQGQSVLSNIKSDRNLVAWAKKLDLYVYIGRPGDWGNPYVIGDDGDRSSVIKKYRKYFSRKTDLQEKLIALHGKVLGCFCHPEPCHGNELLKHLREHTHEHDAH